jgi:hypothetical protein
MSIILWPWIHPGGFQSVLNPLVDSMGDLSNAV